MGGLLGLRGLKAEVVAIYFGVVTSDAAVGAPKFPKQAPDRYSCWDIGRSNPSSFPPRSIFIESGRGKGTFPFAILKIIIMCALR